MKRIGILFCLALCLCSCSKTIDKNDTHHNTKTEPTLNITTKNNAEVISKHIDTLLYDIIGNDSLLSVKCVQDNIIMLAVKNNENIIECHFVDLINEQKIASFRDDNLKGIPEIQCNKTEYVLYSSNSFSYVLDEKFQLKNKIQISDTIYKGQTRNYCILPHNEKIIYYMDQIDETGFYCGLYCTDYQCNNATLLVRLDAPEKNLNNLNGFYTLCPSYDEKMLFFTGYYFDNVTSGATSKPCIGSLDLNDLALNINKSTKEYFHVLEDSALYYDGKLKDDTTSSGELIGIFNDSNIKKWNLQKKIESQSIYVSDKENYILTYTYTESFEDHKKEQSTITCYDRQTSERVCTYTLTIPQSYYDILLCEDRGIIICFYYEDGLKIMVQDLIGR